MGALPPDEPVGHLFKTIFFHRLPGDLKDLVRGYTPSTTRKSGMAARGGGGGRPRGCQGGGKGGGQGQKTLCDKHKKFGKYAHYRSSPKTCS